MLVKLSLTKNKLFGLIPSSLGNLNSLTHLDLSSNGLSGNIPSSISRMGNLFGLYIEENKISGDLNGFLPKSIVWRVAEMNLSYNLLSRNLPENIRNLLYMSVFDVSANRLTGEIPIELGNLTLLQFLDLSRNNLSGRIPEKVCGIDNLASLNLSRNSLEGPIPRIGICANISENSLFGNKNLCGNVVGEICHLTRSKKPKIRWFYWGIPAIGIVSGSVICVLLTYICIIICTD